jgi:hypothetical protein
MHFYSGKPMHLCSGVDRVCAEAPRPAKLIPNDTPTPIINFEAARKLRRDLISVILLENISVTLLLVKGIRAGRCRNLYKICQESSGCF